MAAADSDVEHKDAIIMCGYPKPISPPYPVLSKDVELRRARLAAARSAAYSFSSDDIIFEDEWLLVVKKPSGIYCETLISSLSSSSKTSTLQSNLHLANRLDRDTSGLMLITKSNKASAKLLKAFTDHKVKKTYLALCVGNAPVWEKMKISSGHGRSRYGAWRVYSASDVGRVLPGGSRVKSILTSFEILSVNRRGKFQAPNEGNMDELQSVMAEEGGSNNGGTEGDEKDDILVRAYPESGRTHQVRLHCQHLGFSIRGDVKYGGVHEWKGRDCDFHALHAESLSFEHPITGLDVSFFAPSPSWVSEACCATLNEL
ncbi:RNA pseudouridine synthase 1 [Phalaenopsis equestris]|uniref:RNA pseudouridine synthase 1 n=1 Tax=Phalaenopsis equestris TaxID=78828 RepID=UPI0009E55FE4|nr:RNA pseudouridine synthase 1 [Phalaenopsis equestris]